MQNSTQEQLYLEFDRQVTNLITKGYSKLLNIKPTEFVNLLEPIKEKLSTLSLPQLDIEKGILPFVIVTKSDSIPAETAMGAVERNEIKGVTILRPHTSENFKTIEGINVPHSNFYLLINIDRGKETINLPPNEAIKLIYKQNRSPLTIDEGIAIVTHYPEFLIKNNCFSLLGSRTGTDQRVPAIWINAKKEPNLGWCWDGNPHTWLGSASAEGRVGL